MDESVHKDPSTFYPERFSPQNGEPLPVNTTFGFGRRYETLTAPLTHLLMETRPRICPGRHLADASIWIVVVSILATFDILPAKDENGDDIPPEVKFCTKLSWYMYSTMNRLICSLLSTYSHPEPFKCIIRPRSDSAVQLIQQLQL